MKIKQIQLLIILIFLFPFLMFGEDIFTVPGFSQRLEIQREEIESKEAKFSFLIVNTIEYLSSTSEEEYLDSLVQMIKKENETLFILKPNSYYPKIRMIGIDLFSSEKEKIKFQRYLHDLCYNRKILLSQEEEYSRYTKITEKCYIDKARSFLKGNRTQFSIYKYFGELPEWSETSDFLWGVILYLLLFLSSLPHLFLFLFIFSFFKNYFKEKEYYRKLVTVLVPFVYGFLWIFGSASIGESYEWGFWGMGLWKLYFYVSGLFFGLGFIGVKVLVNRIFYPDEDSLPDWAIGLILLFSPMLIFAAGGAGGGKSSSSSSSSSSNQSSKGSSNLGGGKSGGGGAGGSF